MDKDEFISQIKNISKRVEQLRDTLETEEATKTSLIMPFFQALGYDVFNPLEFVPEYTADVGIKKGEKVDYAIVINDELQILIEAKAINEKLTKHDSQLFRYFTTTSAKFSILTNGQKYEFYTDLDQPNKMDSLPFLNIDLLKIRDAQINELYKFTKDIFNVENITSTASELKYVSEIGRYLAREFEKPSSNFTKYIMSSIYGGRRTENAIEEFKPLITKAANQLITNKVSDKLSNALNTSVSLKNDSDTQKSQDRNHSNLKSDNSKDEIITTPEEIESYATVKLILKDIIDISRVTYRDNKSYFNVLLDNNIRKWILRVYFSQTHNYIELNDESNEKLDFSTPIDIYKYADKIIEIVKNKI